MIGASTRGKSHDEHGKLTNNVGRYIKVNRFCRVSGGPKWLSTRLHRVSQSHQLAPPLLQVQLPSPQRAPLRPRLLKSCVNVLACNTIMLHFSRDSSGFK